MPCIAELSPPQNKPQHPASANPYKHLTRITMNSRKYLERQPACQTSQEITDRFKDNEKKKKQKDAELKEQEMRKNFKQNVSY